jgi:hypothetical protein
MSLTKVSNALLAGPPANIKSFGADDTGSTDSASAIQSALDSGASRVYIPAGTYKILSTITIPSNVSLEGDGVGASILDGRTAGSLTDLSHIRTADGLLTQIPDLASNVSKGDQTLTFVSAPTLVAGDIITIYNPADYSWSGYRDYYRAGETIRVASVSGATVTVQGAMCDNYIAADVDVYRADNRTSCFLRGFSILGKGDITTSVRGILLQDAADSSIQDVRVTGCSYAGISVKNSFNVQVLNCSVEEDFVMSFNTDYGLTIGNSHSVNVIGGYFSASRHAISIGGSGSVGDVPNRYVTISAATLTGTSVVQTADVHGNSELITYSDCMITGGMAIGGDFNKVDNCTLREGSPANGDVVIFITETRGCNYTITNNTFETTGVASNRGTFVDVGGNSTVISASTKLGGTVFISNNLMIWQNTDTEGSSPFKITNRGYALSYPINVNISNNELQCSEINNAPVRNESIIQVITAGSTPFETINVSNNVMSGCGIINLSNSNAGEYSANNVYIHENKCNGSLSGGIVVFDTQNYASIKGNTITNCNFYGITVRGQSGNNTRFIHFTGNSCIDNFRNWISTGTLKSSLILWYADYAVSHDNVTGSFNESIVVDSNSGFVIGELITGGTSGATATVTGFNGSTLIMIERTRSGTFSASETITGGTSGSTATYSSTAYNETRRSSFNTITDLWHGNNVGIQTSSDYINAVTNNNAI